MRTFLITLSLAGLAVFVAAGLSFNLAIGTNGEVVLVNTAPAATEGDPWSGKSSQLLRVER